MIAAILGNDRLDGGDGALDHAVIGLKYRDALEGLSGGGDNTGQLVVVAAAQLDELIA